MTIDTKSELSKTKPVSQDDLERMRLAEGVRSVGTQLTLVIYFRDGVRVIPLVEGGSVVVGRSHPAEVTIRDASLSRQHACFEVEGGRVWVEDLGSTNGTWVDGQQVERFEVKEGAELNLGATMATIQRLGPVDEGALGVISHDRFLFELDAELQRAKRYKRCLALIMIRAGAHEAAHLSRWFPKLRAALEPFEKAALYSASIAEIILPETTEESGHLRASRLLEAAPNARCGLALVSEGLQSADEVLESARAALRRTTEANPIQMGRLASVADDAPQRLDTGGLIAESPAMQKLFGTVGRLSKSAIPVLIRGETGAGKEVVAKAIHEGGKRKDKPLIPVNCGAIPATLIESTLFGHERGAFTGATSQHKGVFEAAHGGTVLLDEIGELPPAAQATLLRVLENKTITRVGSTKEIPVDVRVLAATHRDLEVMCDHNEFRRDLLYRLDAMAVRVPSLKDRPEDIEPLARQFLAQASIANESEASEMSDGALNLLRQYAWPGNVRELRNSIERAAVIAQGPIIDVDDLPESVRNLEQASAGRQARVANSSVDNEGGFEMVNLKAEVQTYEAELIRKALSHTQWERKDAANLLGVPLRTLAHKIQIYDIKKG